MCRHEGLAVAAYGVLGAGHIRTDAEEARRRETGEHGRTSFGLQWERSEEERAVCRVLERIAGEVGVGENIGAVAIAYVMQKAPYVFPLVGGRKVEHLTGNIDALKVRLTDEHIKAIEDAKPFEKAWHAQIIVSVCVLFLDWTGMVLTCVYVACRATMGRFLTCSGRRRRSSLNLFFLPSSPSQLLKGGMATSSQMKARRSNYPGPEKKSGGHIHSAEDRQCISIIVQGTRFGVDIQYSRTRCVRGRNEDRFRQQTRGNESSGSYITGTTRDQT